IASGGGAGTVRVWDAATGRNLLTLRGHTGSVDSVWFSPDEKCLVSTDTGGKEIVWELPSGKSLPEARVQRTVRGPRSPDGLLFARIDGNMTRLHRLPEDTAEERARWRNWVEPDLPWHAEQVRHAEAAGQWFAAAFHQGRLLRSQPWDAGMYVRRAYALSQL